MISARRQAGLFDAMSTLYIEDYGKLDWESWMKKIDQLLDDETMVEIVRLRLQERRPKSRTRGREGTPAEVVLRMLTLKHMKNWSFETLEREVRANLVYRDFTRIGDGKVPDSKTMIKIRQALGSEALEKINQRLVEISIESKITRGRKMRVDTTAVETDVHYPTDSSLLEDGIRAITRKVEKINKELGNHGLKVRNRLRSTKRRAIEIARSARARGEEFKEKKEKSYRKLLTTAKQVIRDAKKVVEHAEQKMKTRTASAKRSVVARLVDGLKGVTGLTEKVVKQTKARIVDGDTHYEGKIVSVFQPETELIRRGKASKPNEFGKMVKIQEAENQIITSYEVYDKKPADSALLIPSIEEHKETFGKVPHLVAADAGFYSSEGISKATEAGVSRVCVPNKKTGSKRTRKAQKEPWFRRGQRWRVGCEGRISVLKRRHGMSRSRYKGTEGVRCWVGMAVMCDNLISMARMLIADP